MKKILFVCAGNICRSPTAEAVLRRMATARNKAAKIDSAGTGGWHAGEPPDARAAAAAKARGYDMTGIAARQVIAADFANFDIVYAMTADHRDFLRRLAPTAAAAQKIRLFAANGEDIPDPYYGDGAGFERMLDLLEEGCAQIVARDLE